MNIELSIYDNKKYKYDTCKHCPKIRYFITFSLMELPSLEDVLLIKKKSSR